MTQEFPEFLERSMKKIYISALNTVWFAACAAFAGVSWAATTGIATFNEAGHTYLGTYSTAGKLITVDIDGLTYRGNYASNADDSGGASTGVPSGKWGRAFMFASSAQVLRCVLDAGFPKVSGQCQGANGRNFKLKFGGLHKTTFATQRSATQ